MNDTWTEPEEEKAPGLELKDLLYAFGRSRYWFVILGGVGLLGGLLAAARVPNTYTSHAKLLLRVGAREEITQEELGGAELDKRSRMPTGPTIEDEVHLLTDERIYRELAAEYGPADVVRPEDPRLLDKPGSPAFRRKYHELQAWLMGVDEPPSDVTMSKATKTLLSSTRIVTEPYSNVITVFHTSTRADKAQELCDLIADAFIKRHRQQFSIEDKLPAYKEKVDEAERQLELAKTNYNAHVFECKLFDVEEDMKSLEEEKQQRMNSLFQAELDLREIDIKLEGKRSLLAETPPTKIEIQPEVTRDNPEYLGKLDSKQRAVSEKWNVQNDPARTTEDRQRLVAAYEAQIVALDKELEGIDKKIVEKPEEQVELPNEDYVALEREITDLEIDRKALVERKGSLEERIDSIGKRSLEMQNCRSTHDKMIADINDKQQAFDKVHDKYQDLEALARIDIEGDTNLQILEGASLPLDKNGPSRPKIVLMGIFAGLMAGGVLAFLRQLLDPRLRYPHVVDRTLHVPVIGVIPDQRSVRALLKRAPEPEATTTG